MKQKITNASLCRYRGTGCINDGLVAWQDRETRYRARAGLRARRLRQDEQVLSMVCSAVFSEDCSFKAQYDFTAIHILAYVHR